MIRWPQLPDHNKVAGLPASKAVFFGGRPFCLQITESIQCYTIDDYGIGSCFSGLHYSWADPQETLNRPGFTLLPNSRSTGIGLSFDTGHATSRASVRATKIRQVWVFKYPQKGRRVNNQI